MPHKYSRQEAQAAALIERAGAIALVTTPDIYDTTQYPPVLQSAGTSNSFYAVSTKVNQTDLANEKVKITDLKLIMQTGMGVPDVDNKLEWDGNEHHIVAVSPVAPAATPVIWKVFARRGTI